MGKHIEPGSTLMYDGEHSHRVLIERLKLKSEVHASGDTKGLPDSTNPLENVNRLHALLKRFMREHGGYDRDDILDWMNLAFFVPDSDENVYLRIERFFALAMSNRKIIRYRDYFSKR